MSSNARTIRTETAGKTTVRLLLSQDGVDVQSFVWVIRTYKDDNVIQGRLPPVGAN